MRELFHTAPTDKRAPEEERCYRFLQEHGIHFARIDHESVDHMEDCLALEKDLGAVICKNLFLCDRQQTHFYLLLMPGDKPFHTKDYSKALGISRLSFAGPEHMRALLDTAPGSASILSLINDPEGRVRLTADTALRELPFLGCHPCKNTSTLRLAAADVFETLPRATGHPLTWVTLP